MAHGSPTRMSPAPVVATRGIARLFPWRGVVMPFLLSRLLSDGLILAMSLARDHPPFYEGFAKHDGGWYTFISILGYDVPSATRETPWPFFPLLPGGMHVLRWFGIRPELGGVLISHLAFLVALAGLHRIASRHTTPRGARITTWAIALFPASFLFSMVYPSSLFLAGSVWAFALVEERRDLAAGLAAAAAVMSRPNGFVVVLGLAVAIAPVGRRAALVCGPAAAAFLGWCLYNLDRTGDALRFYHAKSAWPEVNAIDFVNKFHKYAIPHILLAAAAIAAVVLVWRRLPASWLAFTGLYLLPSLYTGLVGVGRYANECFPPFVAAGEILAGRSRRTVACLFAASILLQVLCVYWVIYEDWLP